MFGIWKNHSTQHAIITFVDKNYIISGFGRSYKVSVSMSILTQTWKSYLHQGMFLTWISMCLMTAHFKSILLPRLDYGSQLWSPFLIKHDSTLCTEDEKGTALSIFGKLLRPWLLTFLSLLQVHFLDVDAGHASFILSM